jgi:intracellular septation protein
LFEALLPSEIELPQSAWLKVTIVSTFQFLMVGALNLYVGFNYSMDTWVTYKLWSPLALTIPWMILLGIIMGPHIKNAQKVANDETTISP